MKIHFLGIASVLLALSACNGLDAPFTFDHATGSCLYPASQGYTYCEDFLGTEYNQSIAQNSCMVADGAWSSDACPSDGALGTCAIDIGGSDAQNVQYTYYPDGATPATVQNAETACGLAGGTFTP